MQFRIYDGDMTRWDDEEIELTPEELKKRFGITVAQNVKTTKVENSSAEPKAK